MMLQYRNFNIELAIECGVDCAIFLQDMLYWIDYNKSSGINFRDGRYWTFNTVKQICERHPYWTNGQVRRIIETCKKNGWILVSEYNQNKYNHTKWYSVSDFIISIVNKNTNSSIDEVELQLEENRIAENCNSYKDKINKEKDINKNISVSPKFEEFWELYPRKQAPANAKRAWDKLKPSKEMFELMKKAIEWQKETEQWTKNDGSFIPLPASWLNGMRWLDEPVDCKKHKNKETLGVGPGWW